MSIDEVEISIARGWVNGGVVNGEGLGSGLDKVAIGVGPKH